MCQASVSHVEDCDLHLLSGIPPRQVCRGPRELREKCLGMTLVTLVKSMGSEPYLKVTIAF